MNLEIQKFFVAPSMIDNGCYPQNGGLSNSKYSSKPTSHVKDNG